MTIEISWIGGNCPVQADGLIDGKRLYFRARGDGWRLEVGGEGVINPEWKYEEDYGDGPFDAGFMSEDEARAFIDKAVALYLARA